MREKVIWSGGLCSEKLDDNPGVHIFKIDPFRCTLDESESFDTYTDRNGGMELRSFLWKVRQGEVVIGVTAGEPTTYLRDALYILQKRYGVNVGDVRIRGSFAFVAQKGYPYRTVLHKVVMEKISNVRPARLKVVIRGV